MTTPSPGPARRRSPGRGCLALVAALVLPPVVGVGVYLLTPGTPWVDPGVAPTFPALVRATILAVQDGAVSAQIDPDAFPGAKNVGLMPIDADLTWTDASGTVHTDRTPPCLRPGTRGQVVELHLAAYHNTDTPGWTRPFVLGVRCPA